MSARALHVLDGKGAEPKTTPSLESIFRACLQSQNRTREASETGQRYIPHAERGSQILFFVRRCHKDSCGETAPYTFLGPATYVTHRGGRPRSITWRQGHAMPSELFEEMKVAAG